MVCFLEMNSTFGMGINESMNGAAPFIANARFSVMGVSYGGVLILLVFSYVVGISVLLYLLNRYVFRRVVRERLDKQPASIAMRVCGFIVGMAITGLFIGIFDIAESKVSFDSARISFYITLVALLVVGTVLRLRATSDWLSQGVSWGMIFAAVWGALTG